MRAVCATALSNPARAIDASRGACVHGDVSCTARMLGRPSQRLGASSPCSHAQPRKAIAPSTQGKRDTRSKRLYPVGSRQHHNSASGRNKAPQQQKQEPLSLTHTDKTDNHVPRDLDRISRNGLCVVADTLPDKYDQFGYFESGMGQRADRTFTIGGRLQREGRAETAFRSTSAQGRVGIEETCEKARSTWR